MKNYIYFLIITIVAASCSSKEDSSSDNISKELSSRKDKTRHNFKYKSPPKSNVPTIIPKEPKRISDPTPVIVENEPNVSRNEDVSKDVANVFWSRSFTLFDLITDEPIFPDIQNGEEIYKIFYSSNEDPSVHYGEFTEEQLERHLFYKFKDIESCMEFCESKNP